MIRGKTFKFLLLTIAAVNGLLLGVLVLGYFVFYGGGQKGKWVTGNTPSGKMRGDCGNDELWLEVHGHRLRGIGYKVWEDIRLLDVRMAVDPTDPDRERYYLSARSSRYHSHVAVRDNRGREEDRILIEFDRRRGTLLLSGGELVMFTPGLRVAGEISPGWGGFVDLTVRNPPPGEGSPLSQW